MLAVDGFIEFISTVQDHEVIIARITKIDAVKDSKPLVWLHGDFAEV